jgi:hypothetical protein
LDSLCKLKWQFLTAKVTVAALDDTLFKKQLIAQPY